MARGLDVPATVCYMALPGSPYQPTDRIISIDLTGAVAAGHSTVVEVVPDKPANIPAAADRTGAVALRRTATS